MARQWPIVRAHGREVRRLQIAGQPRVLRALHAARDEGNRNDDRRYPIDVKREGGPVGQTTASTSAWGTSCSFLAFLASTLLLSVGLFLKVSCEPKPFFKKAEDVWFEGITQALMSYILFWTLFYDIVHIY